MRWDDLTYECHARLGIVRHLTEPDAADSAQMYLQCKEAGATPLEAWFLSGILTMIPRFDRHCIGDDLGDATHKSYLPFGHTMLYQFDPFSRTAPDEQFKHWIALTPFASDWLADTAIINRYSIQVREDRKELFTAYSNKSQLSAEEYLDVGLKRSEQIRQIIGTIPQFVEAMRLYIPKLRETLDSMQQELHE